MSIIENTMQTKTQTETKDSESIISFEEKQENSIFCNKDIPEIEILPDNENELPFALFYYVNVLKKILEEKKERKESFTQKKIVLSVGYSLVGINCLGGESEPLRIHFSFGFVRECPRDQLESEFKSCFYSLL